MSVSVFKPKMPLPSNHPNASKIHAKILEVEHEISKLQVLHQHLTSQLQRVSSFNHEIHERHLDRRGIGDTLGDRARRGFDRQPSRENISRTSSPSGSDISHHNVKSRSRRRRTKLEDPTSYSHSIQQLLQPPSKPFSGNPMDFTLWLKNLNREMDSLDVEPFDAVRILRNHSCGEPKRLIERYMSNHKINDKQLLKLITTELEKRFGAKRDIARGILDKINNLPPVYDDESPSKSYEKIRQFSDTCMEAVIASRNVSSLLILDSPQEMESIRQKLPTSINQRWRRKKFTFIKRHGFEPKFKDFSKFLEREADISASDKYFTCLPAPPKLKDVRRRFKKLFNTSNKTEDATKFCVLHNSKHHDTSFCKAYLKLDPNEKFFLRRKNNLCDRCLTNHFSQPCPKQ